MIHDDGKDDWFDTQSNWIDDIASLISTVILIVLVVMFTGVGFWLAGWL